MQEIWKDIKGYEGKYQISNLGRVKSLKRVIKRVVEGKAFFKTEKEKILKPYKNSHGYLCCGLEGKKINVHLLVGRAFIGENEKGFVFNHKDGNKMNPVLENLEVITHAENCIHAVNFLRKDCIKIFYEGIEYRSKAEMRRMLNISEGKQKKLISEGTATQVGGL